MLARVLAKRVDSLVCSGSVVGGRFDNVSAGVLLKIFDARGLTVNKSRGARRGVPSEESLVPPSVEPEAGAPSVTDIADLR